MTTIEEINSILGLMRGILISNDYFDNLSFKRNITEEHTTGIRKFDKRKKDISYSFKDVMLYCVAILELLTDDIERFLYEKDIKMYEIRRTPLEKLLDEQRNKFLNQKNVDHASKKE